MQWSLEVKETWLHRVNPSFKLLGMLLLFFVVVFIHNINILLNMTIFMLLLYFVATGHVTKVKLLLLIPFVLIFLSAMAPMAMFGKGDTTWWKLGFIHVTEESFFRGVHLGLRATVFGILGLLFALTTKPVLLFYSLMQQCKLPPKYAYSFLAAVRLIPIMIEEFITLRKALIVRGVENKKGLKAMFSKFQFYSIPLLSQSIRRAHRIAVAMEAKRFSKQKNRTYYYNVTMTKNDLIYVSVFCILIGTSYFLSVNYPYFSVTDVRY